MLDIIKNVISENQEITIAMATATGAYIGYTEQMHFPNTETPAENAILIGTAGFLAGSVTVIAAAWK